MSGSVAPGTDNGGDYGTRGRTPSATNRTNPSGSGSSPVGWSTTASAPASASRCTALATAPASPATPRPGTVREPFLRQLPEQPFGSVGSGGGEEIDDEAMRIGTPGGGAPFVDELPSPPYAVRWGGGGEQGPVGALTGEPQRTGPGDTGDDGNGGPAGRPVESDVVEPDVAPSGGKPFPTQQGPQSNKVLPQQGHRRLDPSPHLPHPLLHPVPDRDDGPPGKHPLKSGGLHRSNSNVPQRHGKQPDPDPHPLGPGQRRGSSGDPALPKTVLPKPQLLKPGFIGKPGDGAEVLWRELRTEDCA